ncbi:hypothetical protein LUTEI9C_50167 [Luteimonas sp. 9C]|nr:hypothetical protein LUTEI9C_50167 [Luteimonas sp. 9C]
MMSHGLIPRISYLRCGSIMK